MKLSKLLPSRLDVGCCLLLLMALLSQCQCRRRQRPSRRRSGPFQLHPDNLLISHDNESKRNATHDVIQNAASALESDSRGQQIQQGMNGRRRHVPNDMIVGSRKAITIAKMDYFRENWCKTEQFVQVVRVEGCLKRRITNRFCYGQCNSFFIPKLSKSDRLSAAFENCATCKPKDWDWVTITLRCPGKVPNLLRKRIQSVKRCKCMSQNIV